MSPHVPLLISLCRRPVDSEGVSRGLRLLENIDATEQFLEFAASHRLLGRTLATCAELPGLGPEGFDARVTELLRNCRRRAALFELKRNIALKTLAAHDVCAVVLKGAALAETLYTDPSLRDLEDLDLLVPADRWRQAVRALVGVGYVAPPFAELITYRRHHFHVPVDHPDHHCVELHWSLTRPDSALQLPALPILEEARNAGPILVPRPETIVLHLVIQNVQEGFSRLSRLVDIDRILHAEREFDWDHLVRIARAGGLASATAVTLRLAASLLRSPIPADVERAVRPSTIDATHLALLRPVERLLDQRANQDSALGQLLHLWLLPGVSERSAHLMRLLRVDRGAEVLRGQRPSGLRRALQVTRVGVRQLAVYGHGAWDLTSHAGRSQMRFWSSQASNSERL